ncbi:MBL fold metallo-hydrolase [Cohnella sp. REN36]|uniref:MBL fold metallo-hydrolase n=1 Tax=Cohnella sp. REN36 TaxID=2887347 RepID=UPI001D13D054|nr:MBL fold metallo-hydrolase [Cohnella sp. REN36]MCC3373171.1 MBL fold metallo-hydrolase [Cohnella sp. REN36]
MMKITILGNGDSMGTPRVYCECPVCSEARTTGANARLRSSVWLEAEGEAPLLVDCGPDWRTQMERLGVRQVRQGLLTHAHFDHIGGLAEWADACRWRRETARLYGPAEVLAEAAERFPWIGSRLLSTPNDAGMSYGNWDIRTWKVNHGKNGYAYAYRFDDRTRGVSWAYCPDSIDLTETQKAPLRGLSLLVLGTSYYREPFPKETRSLYDVVEGLALLEELGVPSAVFTHLSHDIDVRRDYALPPRVRFAHAGLVLTV